MVSRFSLRSGHARWTAGLGIVIASALASPAIGGQPIRTLNCLDGQIAVSDGAGWVCRNLPPLDADTQKIAFVTSELYTGALGGISGADAKCQSLAASGSLPGEFRAWLSDSQTSPASRFRFANVPYVRTDGVRIANNGFDLTSCANAKCLQAPLNVDENGNEQTAFAAWTATRADGTPAFFAGGPAAGTCQDWTSAAFDVGGVIGVIDEVSEQWSTLLFQGNPSGSQCSVTQALYCFQQ